MVDDKSPNWPPPGFSEKVKYNNGRKIKVYTDLSVGSKFYSKAAVIRYLNTLEHGNNMTVQNEADKADEPNVIDSNVTEPADGPNVDQTNVDDPNVNGPNVNDQIVDEPSIDLSPQPVPMINTSGINKKRRKDNSFVLVSIERKTDDDLPPGWIKEIKTSKSGKKIRKDPYYTDPVSGYIFRSKLDALRYLKTEDIRNCACRPLRSVLDGVKLIENEIPSSTTPANEKLFVHKRQHLLGEELNGGEESSDTKVPAESEAKISEQKQGNSEFTGVTVTNVHEERISCENSKNNAEMMNTPGPETDPSTNQQLSESGKRTKVGPSKSTKRKDLSLPSRSSKRIAGSEPKMASNLNERSLKASLRNFSANDVDKFPKDPAVVPTPSDIEPSKETEEQSFIGEETRKDPLIDVENLFNEVEEPPTEGPSVPEERLGVEAREKQVDESKKLEESQLGYDFGDAWSDPLFFAYKTLRGDLSLDDSLTLPSCFNEQISIPYEDGYLKESRLNAPMHNEFASSSKPESSAVDYLPGNSSSFSASGSIGHSIGGYNCPSSTDVGKKDLPAKRSP